MEDQILQLVIGLGFELVDEFLLRFSEGAALVETCLQLVSIRSDRPDKFVERYHLRGSGAPLATSIKLEIDGRETLEFVESSAACDFGILRIPVEYGVGQRLCGCEIGNKVNAIPSPFAGAEVTMRLEEAFQYVQPLGGGPILESM